MESKQKVVRFAPEIDPGYAVQLRLSPETLPALRQSGDQATLTLRAEEGQAVLAVGGGGQEFAFKARPQEHCKLVQLKPGQKDEGVAQCLGDMPFKLYPSRTIPSRPPSVLACAAQPGPAAALPQASDGSEPSFGLYAKAVAAARLSDLRRIIIALLAQHPASLRSLKQKVVSAMQASSSPDPPPSQADLEKCVKSVAFYKAPGVYVLNQGLEAELHSLVATVDTAPQDTPPSGAIKRRKLNSPVDGEEGAHAPDRHCDTPTAPSIGTESDGRMGSDGVQQHQLRRLSCPPSSSSRGSESADERWVLEHCGRCPQTIRITTEQERVAAEAEFKSKYEVYFRLRQLIMANRQDFEALMSAVDAATTDAEKERSQEEVRRLWTRRGTRAKRWRAAFDVLHEELAGIKESLARYSEQAWPSSEGAASPPASHDS